MTAAQAGQLLFLLSGFSRLNTDTESIQIIVSCMIATVKQGNVTARFLQKITRGIDYELSIQVELDSEAIRLIYHRLLVNLSDENICYILQRWHNQLPPDALRLRLTLEQASGSGLTVLSIAGRAMTTYPNFYWDRVQRVFPTEWASFVAAVNAVGNNPWYGYRKNLGIVSSTKYKTVGWIAKELLVRINGETTLMQYKGWPRRIPDQERVEEWILDFIRRRGEALEEADNRAFAEPRLEADLQDLLVAAPDVYV